MHARAKRHAAARTEDRLVHHLLCDDHLVLQRGGLRCNMQPAHGALRCSVAGRVG
jgi:hypothetical protein